MASPAALTATNPSDLPPFIAPGLVEADTSAPALQQLPLEMIFEVKSHLVFPTDGATFKSCCRINSLWRHVFQPDIFRRIRAHTHLDLAKVHKALASSPHLRQVVRALELRDVTSRDPDTLFDVLRWLPDVEDLGFTTTQAKHYQKLGNQAAALAGRCVEFYASLAAAMPTRRLRRLRVEYLPDFPMSILEACGQLEDVAFTHSSLDSAATAAAGRTEGWETRIVTSPWKSVATEDTRDFVRWVHLNPTCFRELKCLELRFRGPVQTSRSSGIELLKHCCTTLETLKLRFPVPDLTVTELQFNAGSLGKLRFPHLRHLSVLCVLDNPQAQFPGSQIFFFDPHRNQNAIAHTFAFLQHLPSILALETLHLVVQVVHIARQPIERQIQMRGWLRLAAAIGIMRSQGRLGKVHVQIEGVWDKRRAGERGDAFPFREYEDLIVGVLARADAEMAGVLEVLEGRTIFTIQ